MNVTLALSQCTLRRYSQRFSETSKATTSYAEENRSIRCAPTNPTPTTNTVPKVCGLSTLVTMSAAPKNPSLLGEGVGEGDKLSCEAVSEGQRCISANDELESSSSDSNSSSETSAESDEAVVEVLDE